MAKCEVCQKDMFFGRKIRITRSLTDFKTRAYYAAG